MQHCQLLANSIIIKSITNNRLQPVIHISIISKLQVHKYSQKPCGDTAAYWNFSNYNSSKKSTPIISRLKTRIDFAISLKRTKKKKQGRSSDSFSSGLLLMFVYYKYVNYGATLAITSCKMF